MLVYLMCMQSELVPALMRVYVRAETAVGLDVDKDSFDKFTLRWRVGACAAAAAAVQCERCGLCLCRRSFVRVAFSSAMHACTAAQCRAVRCSELLSLRLCMRAGQLAVALLSLRFVCHEWHARMCVCVRHAPRHAACADHLLEALWGDDIIRTLIVAAALDTTSSLFADYLGANVSGINVQSKVQSRSARAGAGAGVGEGRRQLLDAERDATLCHPAAACGLHEAKGTFKGGLRPMAGSVNQASQASPRTCVQVQKWGWLSACCACRSMPACMHA